MQAHGHHPRNPMSLYPDITPYATGHLDVGDGHVLHYELCGNPEGLPAVVLHGGPGAGCSATHRRFFDPTRYRIVLFDQRGAGRSRPKGSLEANTTAHLVADIETLRRHLGIERWLVFGGSWGSTLALAYAEQHRARCAALVLRGIWLCRDSDLAWGFGGLRQVYPEAFRVFAAHFAAEEHGDLLAACVKRLSSGDHDERSRIAVAYTAWEQAGGTLLPDTTPVVADEDTLAAARIGSFYHHHRAFISAERLIASAAALGDLPGAIVHGRYDMLCPAEGALAVAEAWPAATFTMVPDAGHAATEPGIAAALVRATDRLADAGRWRG